MIVMLEISSIVYCMYVKNPNTFIDSIFPPCNVVKSGMFCILIYLMISPFSCMALSIRKTNSPRLF